MGTAVALTHLGRMTPGDDHAGQTRVAHGFMDVDHL